MKKSLLFSAVAFFASVFAANADNALTKTQMTYSGTNNGNSAQSEYRFRVPMTAIGHALDENASFSVGFWVNRSAEADGTEDDKALLIKLATEIHENNNGAFSLYVTDAGKLSVGGWGVGNKGAGGDISDFTMALNQWYYMLVTLDNANRKFCIYVDQTKVYDKDLTGAITYNPSDEDGDGTVENPIFSFGGYCFSGMMDNIQVYNRALDEDEALVAYYAPQKMTAEIEALYEF